MTLGGEIVGHSEPYWWQPRLTEWRVTSVTLKKFATDGNRPDVEEFIKVYEWLRAHPNAIYYVKPSYTGTSMSDPFPHRKWENEPVYLNRPLTPIADNASALVHAVGLVAADNTPKGSASDQGCKYGVDVKANDSTVVHSVPTSRKSERAAAAGGAIPSVGNVVAVQVQTADNLNK
ncbi:MAG: hypothetical protein AAB393_01645, partial [Bacteroidota bacterium]